MTFRPAYVRDPFDTSGKTVYVAGFQAGTFVWCGRRIRQEYPNAVTLYDAKAWPYMATLPYNIEQLDAGVVYSDGLFFALDLKAAVDMCLVSMRKRKERLDRAFSQVSALSKAVDEKNLPLISGAIAEEHGTL